MERPRSFYLVNAPAIIPPIILGSEMFRLYVVSKQYRNFTTNKLQLIFLQQAEHVLFSTPRILRLLQTILQVHHLHFDSNEHVSVVEDIDFN